MLGWGSENTVSKIEIQLDVLAVQIEAVFATLEQKGLGDIFRSAVLEGGFVTDADLAGLSAADRLDLTELFNETAIQEMASGIYMMGGNNTVAVAAQYMRKSAQAARAYAMAARFNVLAAQGNNIANAVKGDMIRLAALIAQKDALEQKKALAQPKFAA